MLHASRSYGFSSNFFSAFFTFSGIYSAAACKTTQMAQDKTVMALNGRAPRCGAGGDEHSAAAAAAAGEGRHGALIPDSDVY